MSQLTALQHRLSAFRYRRQLARWGMAWSAVLIGAMSLTVLLFGLDVAWKLSVAQRLAIILLAVGAMFWIFKKFSIPWLGVRESETDVALFVQSQHGIDSDLVAALQFDQSANAIWGSRELQQAVVTRVAELSPQLVVTRGTDDRPLVRRAQLVGALFILFLVTAFLFPRHAAVFLSRFLFLANRHYPSSTIVETIWVNGAPVWKWNSANARPNDFRAAKNRPVTFVVRCTGELPHQGSVECRSRAHTTAKTLELRKLSSAEIALRFPAAHASANRGAAMYFAELPRIVEEFNYIVRLGDAYTDPAEVRIIEPPMVDLAVTVTPPDYAVSSEPEEQSPRLLSVLEGSRVGIELQSLLGNSSDAGQSTSEKENSSRAVKHPKSLKTATIRIAATGSVKSYSFVNPAGDGIKWSLPSETPLSRVQEELRYEIVVEDRDGMGLESPLQGLVQLKVDRPPTAAVAIVHRVVLAEAKPVLEFRLNDDYGIAWAKLTGQIERQPGPAVAATDNPAANPPEKLEVDLPLNPLPRKGQNLPYRSNFALDLAKYNLAKGDQLKLVLSVSDFRGETMGQQAMSEPVMLEISDEAGVLAAITEADERTEKRLSDVIKQQLGVGDNQ